MKGVQMEIVCPGQRTGNGLNVRLGRKLEGFGAKRRCPACYVYVLHVFMRATTSAEENIEAGGGYSGTFPDNLLS